MAKLNDINSKPCSQSGCGHTFNEHEGKCTTPNCKCEEYTVEKDNITPFVPKDESVSGVPRDGTVKMTRGGTRVEDPNKPRFFRGSLIEQMMPNFVGLSAPREKQQWLLGKVTRQDLAAEAKNLQGVVASDLSRMHQGLSLLTTMNEAMDSKLETLIRLLSETNVIDSKKYHEYTKLQLEFKRTLDGINFVKDLPMKDKVSAAINWNEINTSLPIHGDYIHGLRDWLKGNPDKLTGEELVHICEVFFLDPVEILEKGVVASVLVNEEMVKENPMEEQNGDGKSETGHQDLPEGN